MRSIITKSLAVSALFLAVSCGSPDDLGQDNGAETSELTSLTGGVSFPCQSYGVNLNDPKFVCQKVTTGGSETDVLYQLDGFTASQMSKLRSALLVAGDRFSAHWKAPSQPSPLLSCIVRNTSNSKDPTGSTLSKGFPEDDRKAIWALTTLNLGFTFHKNSKRAIVVRPINVQLSADGAGVYGRATIGNDRLPVTNPMDFSINKNALDFNDKARTTFDAASMAGIIVHEMLHTRGYEHPEAGRSIGPLVYEAGNCITDVNTVSKNLGLTGGRKKILPEG